MSDAVGLGLGTGQARDVANLPNRFTSDVRFFRGRFGNCRRVSVHPRVGPFLQNGLRAVQMDWTRVRLLGRPRLLPGCTHCQSMEKG